MLTLYRGMYPTLLGILPYAGLAFYTFESLKHVRVAGSLVNKWRGPWGFRVAVTSAFHPSSLANPRVCALSSGQLIVDYSGHEPTSIQRLFCGGMAGFVGQSGTSA